MKSLEAGTLLGVSIMLAGLAAAMGQQEQTPSKAPESKNPAPKIEYTITGPFTHGNLAIFLIQGPETLASKHFLTLQEAVAQKKAIVHETQNVGQLTVENVGRDVDIFIQSGDIVQGGQQDRILAVDLLVPPQTKMPIPSFCVEHGRWQQRGLESAAVFEKVPAKAPSKDLKLAVNYRRDQRLVWREVAQAQSKLSQNLGAAVQGGASATSLPLSLENKKLLEATTQYEKELAKVVEGNPGVIGYAYVVNGQVSGAEVFGSGALFRKLWPDLLRSNAIEAVAEAKNAARFEPATTATIKAFLNDADQGQSSAKEVTRRIRVITRETKKGVCFETHDREANDKILHRSYVGK
jgi:hypothetical protein